MTEFGSPGQQSTAHSSERQTGSAILERLEELEDDNRRLRRLSIASLVVVAMVLGLGAALIFLAARHGLPGTTAEVVAARQFVLRDGQASIRGVWGSMEDGGIRLVFNDSAGNPRVKLTLLQDGSSGLSFPDEKNRARIVLGVLSDATSTLVLADQTSQPRAVLGVNEDGASTISFADRSGATKAGLGVDSRGMGTFSLVDRIGSSGIAETGGEGESTDPALDSTDSSDIAPVRRPARRK